MRSLLLKFVTAIFFLSLFILNISVVSSTDNIGFKKIEVNLINTSQAEETMEFNTCYFEFFNCDNGWTRHICHFNGDASECSSCGWSSKCPEVGEEN